jgi:hypothetical protein
MARPIDPDYVNPLTVWSRKCFLDMLEEEDYTHEFNDRQDSVFLTRILRELNKARTPQALYHWVMIGDTIFLSKQPRLVEALNLEIAALEATTSRLRHALNLLIPKGDPVL